MLATDELNVLAIAVASLINIILGAFWYSPAGFGKLWSRIGGTDIMKMPKSEANKAIAFVGLGAVVQSIVLAIVINTIGSVTFTQGLVAGFILWLGFVAAVSVGEALYSRKGWKFWWLNTSFFLIVMVVNSVLFAVWK